MPIIQVHLAEGRTDEQKRRLIDALTEAVVSSLRAPRESVRVLLTDVPKSNWGIGGRSMLDIGG